MLAVASGNTGLTFIWIPQLFETMAFGRFFMGVFFLALVFAALSSLIAMIEMSTRIFMDAGLSRRRAIAFVATGAFVLGLPSALHLNFFYNQDWAWGLGLMVSGMFFAFAAIKYGVEKFRTELVNQEGGELAAGKWFNWIVTVIIPVEFVVLLSWWFWQAVTTYDPQRWWHPFRTFSLGTCLFQWGVALLLFLVLNNWLFRKSVLLAETNR